MQMTGADVGIIAGVSGFIGTGIVDGMIDTANSASRLGMVGLALLFLTIALYALYRKDRFVQDKLLGALEKNTETQAELREAIKHCPYHDDR